LPNNRLGRAMFKKLKVYSGNEHPHQAQISFRRPERSEGLRMTEKEEDKILPKER
jgi:ribosomal protein L13